MSRLIDADALLEGRQDHEMISTHLIWNAPTIDAVPVVRCKDCKYYNTIGICNETSWAVCEDSFCCWAERKDDGTN